MTGVLGRRQRAEDRRRGFSDLDIANMASVSGTGDVQGDLTGNVGSNLYMSPEVCAESTGSAEIRVNYNEKVDIYSLGVVLFEMFYRRTSTGMERAIVFNDIRSPAIVFPPDWDEKALQNQTTLIRALLQHDASQRPSAADILSSHLLPPPKSQESDFRKHVLEVLKDPSSNLYRFITNSLLTMTCSRSADYLYDWSKFLMKNPLRLEPPLCYLTPPLRLPPTGGVLPPSDEENSARLEAFSNFQLFERRAVHHLEAIFAAHCAFPLQPATLIPVNRHSTAVWLARNPLAAATATTGLGCCEAAAAEAAMAPPPVSNTTIGGPLFLDAQGVPVSLPDALHLGLARLFASVEVTPGSLGDLRTYQVGRVYRPWPFANPFRAMDHPLESKRASFDILATSYQPHLMVELFHILSEVASLAPLEDATYVLYLNLTELVEYIFQSVGLPAELRGPLWQHLAQAAEFPRAEPILTTSASASTAAAAAAASTSRQRGDERRDGELPFRRYIADFPDFLFAFNQQRIESNTGSGRRRGPSGALSGHTQRSLLRLLRVQTTVSTAPSSSSSSGGGGVSALKAALLAALPAAAKQEWMTSATRETHLEEICKRLSTLLKTIQRWRLFPLLKIVLTPGLVLPSHLYQGLIYQLVCCPSRPDQFANLPEDMEDQLAFGGVVSGATEGGVGGGEGGQRYRRMMVLAVGGEYPHLLQRFRPPKEFLHVQVNSSLGLAPNTWGSRGIENGRSLRPRAFGQRRVPPSSASVAATLEKAAPTTPTGAFGVAVFISRLAKLLLYAAQRQQLLPTPASPTTQPISVPLLLSTTLCHVLVSWERRENDAQLMSFERRCRRNKTSPGEASAAAAAEGNLVYPPPAGSELTAYGFPAQRLFENAQRLSFAQQKAFELACLLWSAAASCGGFSTRLVLKKSQDPLGIASDAGARVAVRVCHSVGRRWSTLTYKTWNLYGNRPGGESATFADPCAVLAQVRSTLGFTTAMAAVTSGVCESESGTSRAGVGSGGAAGGLQAPLKASSSNSSIDGQEDEEDSGEVFHRENSGRDLRGDRKRTRRR